MTKQFNSPRVKHDILEHSWEVIHSQTRFQGQRTQPLLSLLSPCLQGKGGCKLSWFLQEVVSTGSDDGVFSYAICSFTGILT